MHRNLFVFLLAMLSLNLIFINRVNADDPVDDEIRVAKELTTMNPQPVEPVTSTEKPEREKFYMCLIYCHCGCKDSHCCSGCKLCTKEQLTDLFMSNMNENENETLREIATEPTTIQTPTSSASSKSS